MRLHFVLSTESLVTFAARERFLASVNPDVFVTVMFQGELFRAEPTLWVKRVKVWSLKLF